MEQADEEGFVEALLEGQPDAPVYFGRNEAEQDGPHAAGEVTANATMRASLRTVLDDDEVVFVDTRAPEAFKEGGSRLAQHPSGGELRHPGLLDHRSGEGREADRAAGEGRGDARALRDKLARVGIDNAVGYVTSLRGLQKERGLRLTGEAQGARDPFVLDARAKGEYEAAHIPGATPATVDVSCGTFTSCRATGRSSCTARQELAAPWWRARCGRRDSATWSNWREVTRLREDPGADGQGVEHERRTLCEGWRSTDSSK